MLQSYCTNNKGAIFMRHSVDAICSVTLSPTDACLDALRGTFRPASSPCTSIQQFLLVNNTALLAYLIYLLAIPVGVCLADCDFCTNA